ncbi:MAG: 4-alpha-glucanotransferase [Paludibacteraceae bacterium]|nr:4-alpha-glucanotransferase [Paludibacteraceae bacterium]
MQLVFTIHYHTAWGQNVHIQGSLPQMGGGNALMTLPMEYQGDGRWRAAVEVSTGDRFTYHYVIVENRRIVTEEWGPWRQADLTGSKAVQCTFDDSWRAHTPDKIFYGAAFSNYLIPHHHDHGRAPHAPSAPAVRFNLLAARISDGLTFAILGNLPELGNWETGNAIPLSDTRYPQWSVDISFQNLPAQIEYKYVLYDVRRHAVIAWESGENRVLRPFLHNEEIYIRNDECFRYTQSDWKCAGVSIPVFSLRTKNSFGIGEYTDIAPMADWARTVGMRMIQTLPVNDTTRYFNNGDAFPYSTMTVMALHPIYINPEAVGRLDTEAERKAYRKLRDKLNASDVVLYEEVLKAKWDYFHKIFKRDGAKTMQTEGFRKFVGENESWLLPYAAFSYLRDKFKTPDFKQWGEWAVYDKQRVQTLLTDARGKEGVDFYIFLQYHAHLQLLKASQHARNQGIILKGDIPIGIAPDSVDAWTEPQLFHLDRQAGAPPDPFSQIGQNWGFPTYNWEEMQRDNYAWWQRRLRKMAYYFQAYRIDHVRGFFRIWNMPQKDVMGLLGQFDPALPMDENEIRSYGVDFEPHRMTHPYIREYMLPELFGEKADVIKSQFLDLVTVGIYRFKEQYNTQKKLLDFFAKHRKDYADPDDAALAQHLMDLHCEVLFVEDMAQPGKYHPRIGLQATHSFKDLDEHTQQAMNTLYTQFHYTRHNDFWRAEAMKKLPRLLECTDMLCCAEDLGMIPACVPQVLADLQMLSLEIDRISKWSEYEFMQPDKIPYLSVCTSSTHDMKPLRAWWAEDYQRSSRYYHQALHEQGDAPVDCEPWVCERIIQRLLASPSILLILPFQDWMAMDGQHRRADAEAERINIPADGNNYWKYRMHLSVEELAQLGDFNQRIRNLVCDNGRLNEM